MPAKHTTPSPALRQFYTEAPLGMGAVALLPALQHRLSKVLRLQPGAEIALFNGQQGLWAATVADKACKTVQIHTHLKPQPEAAGAVLVLGLPKREAWEAAVRQATEMGVVAIQPLATAYAQRGSFNAVRATVLAIEAAEQSERLTLPLIHAVKTFPQWLETLAEPCLWAHARGVGLGKAPQGGTQVLVGPEGGFSPAEEEALAAHPQVRPVHLPTGILRTDTAVVALLTAQGLMASPAAETR